MAQVRHAVRVGERSATSEHVSAVAGRGLLLGAAVHVAEEWHARVPAARTRGGRVLEAVAAVLETGRLDRVVVEEAGVVHRADGALQLQLDLQTGLACSGRSGEAQVQSRLHCL